MWKMLQVNHTIKKNRRQLPFCSHHWMWYFIFAAKATGNSEVSHPYCMCWGQDCGWSDSRERPWDRRVYPGSNSSHHVHLLWPVVLLWAAWLAWCCRRHFGWVTWHSFLRWVTQSRKAGLVGELWNYCISMGRLECLNNWISLPKKPEFLLDMLFFGGYGSSYRAFLAMTGRNGLTAWCKSQLGKWFFP